MPGDEEVRKQAERDAGLQDDRMEVELRARPDGKIEEVPREAVSIREVDGRLVKKKAVMLHDFNEGCGHALHAPEVEARLDAETGLQGGYCQACQKLNCRLCLRESCWVCGKSHDTCRTCGRTCCKKCLQSGFVQRGEQRACHPECIVCKNERREAERQQAEAARRAAAQYASQNSGCVLVILTLLGVGVLGLAACNIIVTSNMDKKKQQEAEGLGMNPTGTRQTRDEAVKKLYGELKILGLLSWDRWRRLYESLEREFDQDIYALLKEKAARVRHLENLCPTPLLQHLPMRCEAAGEIRIGSVLGNGFLYGINTNERGVGVFGTTGCGKSVLNRIFLHALISRGWPCVIFSKKRGDAHSIARMFPDRVVVFRIADGNLRYNALEGGPGVGIVEALSVFTDGFCQAFRLLEASGEYILARLAELVALLGTRGHPDRLPSMFEFYQYLDQRKGRVGERETQYHGTVLSRTRGLLGFHGEIFYCSRGFSFERALLDGWTIVIETDSIKEEIALFITINITLRLFSWMLCPDSPKPKNGISLFLDDSQEVFDARLERRTDEHLPLMGMMAARFRQAGILVASVQVPSLTSSLLRQNLGTTLLMRQGNYDEALVAGRSIGMTDEECKELLRLKTGECIAFKQSYPSPVRVKIEAPNELLH